MFGLLTRYVSCVRVMRALCPGGPIQGTPVPSCELGHTGFLDYSLVTVPPTSTSLAVVFPHVLLCSL